MNDPTEELVDLVVQLPHAAQLQLAIDMRRAYRRRVGNGQAPFDPALLRSLNALVKMLSEEI